MTEEELEFARVVRDLVARSAALDARIRALDEGAHDDEPWRHLDAMGLFELGPGLLDGSTLPALAVILEELGRELVTGPFVDVLLAHAALGAGQGAAGDARRDGAPLTLAVLEPDVELRDGRISGTTGAMPDGQLAERLVLVTGAQLAVVDAGDVGVDRIALESFDLTKRPARFHFDAVEPLATRALTPDTVAALHSARAVLDAAIDLGAAAGCLDRTIAYARDRFQFGVPIGAFQAVKHPLADLFTETELCRALLHAAASHAPVPDLDAAMVTWMASTTQRQVAIRCIQLHGGIGMTWEHPMHLYLRRAQASGAGTAASAMALLRSRVGELLAGDPADASPSDRRRSAPRRDHAPATWHALGPDELAAVVEGWVREHLPEAWLTAADADDRASLAALLASDDITSAWFRQLGTIGLTAPDWPRRYGGLDLGDSQVAVVAEVLGRYDAGVPSKHFTAVSHAGPTVLVWGSDDLRDRLLPRIVDGSDVWCQMFSEPGAGSDLAGLATRARRDGDMWRIDGQKVWTSYARESQYAILIARSHPDLPKHRGLTYFVLDMSTPGIEIRPIRQLTGASEFNEVFLDDVQIPDALRLGAPGEGWRVAITTLMAERTGIGRRPPSSGGPALALLRRALTAGWTTDGATCERLLELVIRERAIDRLAARGAERSLAGQSGPEGSITKITRSELAQRVSEMGQLLEGEAGAYWPAGHPSPAAAAVLSTRLGTIAGGTSEILRNVLAERVLGLPKDAGISATVPWSELRRS